VCGVLCSEERGAADYSGMDCAIAARVRLLAAPGDPARPPLAERCIAFVPAGDTPSAEKLVDLFDTGRGPGRPITVGSAPRTPFFVELALYAPGSLPCADDQPLVGLGRSRVIDPQHDSGPVAVPIGCRTACETHSNGTVRLLSIEDLQTPVATPSDLTIGEIVSYDPFVATAGVCAAPPPTAFHGVFRSFAVTHSGDALSGQWVAARSTNDGCTALAGTSNGGRQLSCLTDDWTSRATLQGFVLDAAHLEAVLALNDSVGARLGALVIRVVDARMGGLGESAVGASVSYTLPWALGGADYPTDDAWTRLAPVAASTTFAGLGVAIFADAPTGSYLVTLADGTLLYVNAGGADDPRSVTTVVVSARP
jgi:hypothetical protein